MEKKILYFGYGANRDPKMMEWITGNKTLVGRPGVLKGYTLCVQKLSQVPDSVFPTAPAPFSARANIIAGGWTQTFTSYNIKEDPKGEVYGTIWELSPQDRELVRDWELIDFGWYKDIKDITAETEDGQRVKIETEGLREGQEVDREVNGKYYPPFLNNLEDFLRVAEQSRGEYFARLQTEEGTLSSKKV